MPSCGELTRDSDGMRQRCAQIAELIEGAQTIAIAGHTTPDGDALGSVLGLGLSIRARHPEKDVAFLLADDAPVPRIYRFLAGADELLPACRYEIDPDLFIAVDSPVPSRLADAGALVERAGHVVCFDHHPACCDFADVTIRRVKCAATAVLIDEFLIAWGMEPSSAVATCLLCGLVTDTGRFQYQNTDADALCCASHLVSCGAEPARVALEVYQSQRLAYLRLESVVMWRIKTAAGGRVAYSYACSDDLATYEVSQDECDGLVDVVRSVGGVEVCLFLKETTAGCVRANLRSKGELDVSGIAAAFGGGGHAAAAGFTYEGTIEDALEAALPMLVSLVDGDAAEAAS